MSAPVPTRCLPEAISLDAAIDALARGGLVAFPTETVYGLGADASDPRAIARIYEAKGRPSNNPLIAHVDGLAMAEAQGLSGAARALAEALWPGPLTIVVPASADCVVHPDARAGLPTVALRCPAHPFARAMIAGLGRPVVAPSANRSGYVSPTRVEHVLADLDGRIELIVDGGRSAVGLESTVVSVGPAGARLLRPGFVLRETVARILDAPVPDLAGDADAPLSPGRLASHYAPRTPVRLDADAVAPDEVLLDFGDAPIAGQASARARITLSARGDLNEACATLYEALRDADALNARAIAVAPIPDTGLGAALRDRLTRAAAR